MALADSIVAIVVAILSGGAIAAWIVARNLRRQFDARLHHVVTTLRRQHEAVVDNLNAAHETTKKDFERQRASAQRASAASASSAAVKQLEERLSAAYAELDRLRLQVKGPAPGGKAPVNGKAARSVPPPPRPTVEQMMNGFAATQPFEA